MIVYMNCTQTLECTHPMSFVGDQINSTCNFPSKEKKKLPPEGRLEKMEEF